MSDGRYIIYALVDPRDVVVFYVGRSSSGLARARNHWSPTTLARSNAELRERIVAILGSGASPVAVELERLTAPAGLNDAEVRWIEEQRASGAPLANRTRGGKGQHGATHSAEARGRISAARAGVSWGRHTDESRARISAAKRGQGRGMQRGPLPLEVRRKISLRRRASAAVPRPRVVPVLATEGSWLTLRWVSA